MPMLSRTLPSLPRSVIAGWLITAMALLSRSVPPSRSDLLRTTVGGRSMCCWRNCAAVTEADASPLFSCSSCSARPSREGVQKRHIFSVLENNLFVLLVAFEFDLADHTVHFVPGALHIS